VVVLGGGALAQRLRIAPPVLLLIGGAVAGFVPALRTVSLPPGVVLLLFLPALLYWESLTTSLREIRSNLRVIVLLSTVLVIVTAAAVAAVAHALGLPWGPAWILGAAVAPTDATAVGVIGRLLPRRTFTVLRAESLVNDGTALVIYALAVGITVGQERLSIPHVTWLFALAYVGGALAGALAAYLAMAARHRLRDQVLENVVSLLTPFVAFLFAELIHASGVLAVVVCGLILSQTGPRYVSAATRQQAHAFWTLATYTLNGALFVLVGVQAQASVRGLRTMGIGHALLAVLVISAVVVGTRFAWNFTTPYLLRAVDRRPAQRLRRVGARGRVVSAMAGVRGAVSLAAALGVPTVLRSGQPFPDRDVIVFVTSGVIVVTLLLGLLVPAVVRWARLPEDTGVVEERQYAELTAAEDALAALPETAGRLGTDERVIERTVREYQKRIAVLRADGARGPDEEDDQEELAEEVAAERRAKVETARRVEADYTALRLELIARKRATVVRLRDERQIDDTVLRQIQARLDVEEIRLSRPEAVE
jgi:CPA1 family monovalent cation:H+ antiporter